jgi:hypothetical protein
MHTLTRPTAEPDTRCTCGGQLASSITSAGIVYRHTGTHPTCTTPAPVPCAHQWCTGDATVEPVEDCPARLDACCSCCLTT